MHTRRCPWPTTWTSSARRVDAGDGRRRSGEPGQRGGAAGGPPRPRHVHRADFTDALEKILLGAERKLMIGEADRAADGLPRVRPRDLGMLTPGADPVRKVSIIPRGMALGVTLPAPDDDRFNYSEDYLRARSAALGGRAAEELVFDEITTGAENDIQQVTGSPAQWSSRWGMSERVGFIVVAPERGHEPAAPGRGAGIRGHAGAGRRGGQADRRRGVRGHPHAAERQPREARLTGRRRCSSTRRSTSTTPTRPPASSAAGCSPAPSRASRACCRAVRGRRAPSRRRWSCHRRTRRCRR